MARRYFSLFPSLAMIAIAAAGAVSIIERMTEAIIAWLAPAKPDTGDPVLAISQTLTFAGLPNDPALVQSFRHEAGFFRRSSSRSG